MSRKKRGSSRYFVFFLLILAGLWGGWKLLRQLLQSWDLFTIERITLEGNINLDTDFLLNLCSDFIGANLFSVNRDDIRKKFENVIRIRDLKVRKNIPGRIHIRISERQAILLVRSAEGILFPVDEEGVVLDNEKISLTEVLPVVSSKILLADLVPGKTFQNDFFAEVIKLYREIKEVDPGFFQNISEIYRRSDYIYLVEVNKGYEILFGEGEIAEKVKRYNFVEQNRTFERGSVVDLRFNQKLIVRPEDK
ncbi:MAG: FtsQ-type POTRA domain-containing protein [Candidatus Cloacimonetes bacterium]|nr:FtsQ-type POTRA domain-containing protein [Candidatus Cloacimonadota bacterium]